MSWTRSNKTAMAAFADAAGFGRRAWQRSLVMGSGSGKTLTLLHELAHAALDRAQTPSPSSDSLAIAGGGLPSSEDYRRTPAVVSPTSSSLASIMWRWRLWQINPAELVQAFMLRLTALWRRADPARFARLMALQLRLGRLWAMFRPPRPPGQLMMSSSHMTRGPDLLRMTQTSWSSAVSRVALT